MGIIIVSRSNVNMYSQFIRMLIIAYILSMKGNYAFRSENCFKEGTGNCSQYIICTEDVDINVYPGRIKTLVYDIYIPRGLTLGASALLATPSDMSVIISDVHLTYQDDYLTLTNGTYVSVMTENSGMLQNYSSQGTYYFGDLDCNGTLELVNIHSTSTLSPVSYSISLIDSMETTNSEMPNTLTTIYTDSLNPTIATKINTLPTISTNSLNPTDTLPSMFTDSLYSAKSIMTNKVYQVTSEPAISSDSINTMPNTVETVSSEPTISTESNNPTDSINTTDPSDITTTANIAAKDPCTYCLVKLAVEYLMADITDVSDNSSRVVTATIVSENVTMEVSTTLVLRPIHNTSMTSNFTTDIPDQVEFTIGGFTRFEIRMILRSPLSAYKLELSNSDPILKIVSVRTLFIGDHFEDIMTELSSDKQPLCSGGLDASVLDFGFLPNKGYYDSKASAHADLVVFEIVLSLNGEAAAGDLYTLNINMEVDFMVVMNSTKHFNVTNGLPRERLNVTSSQRNALLPKGGTGRVSLIWYVPPLSSGGYQIKTSTKRYSGAGGDGLFVGGVQVGAVGSNLPCVPPSRHWKSSNGVMYVANVGYNSGYNANKFGFAVNVVVLPDIAEAGSSHELTATIIYQGEGSPQSFKFYFNVSDQEIFTAPDRNGNLPLNIYLNEQCRSITHSSDVEFILHTNFGRQYGRLIAELPMPTSAMGQSFKLCDFELAFTGRNIVGRFNTTTIKGREEMIEKAFVDMTPLTNIYFASFDRLTVNYVTMKMLVTYIDQNIQINESALPFIARVISNNKTIWTGELPVPKPSIEYYPNFIVLTAIVKIAEVNPENLWYHYSRNGTYYHKEKIVWQGESNDYVFEFSKVIAYFYFTTNTCTVICNVTTEWLPLTDYVTFVKDDSNVLLKKLPYALDQDLNTCFDLPLPGESPSMIWLRITRLSLFGVTSQIFVVSITGEGIECARVGQKSLLVGTSGSASNAQCSNDSDISFCRLVLNNTINAKTRCDVKCECDTQCSDVHVLMQSTNNDDWRMCELSVNDVI